MQRATIGSLFPKRARRSKIREAERATRDNPDWQDVATRFSNFVCTPPPSCWQVYASVKFIIFKQMWQKTGDKPASDQMAAEAPTARKQFSKIRRTDRHSGCRRNNCEPTIAKVKRFDTSFFQCGFISPAQNSSS